VVEYWSDGALMIADCGLDSWSIGVMEWWCNKKPGILEKNWGSGVVEH